MALRDYFGKFFGRNKIRDNFPVAYLKDNTIIIGFPGGEHVRRKEGKTELGIRNYLDSMFSKKRIKTKKKDTRHLPENEKDLRGNGVLDRAFHNGTQYHFYNGRSEEETKTALEMLQESHGVVFKKKVPRFILSDLERIV